MCISTASLLLTNCPGVQLKDHEWCGSLASDGAACFHELTSDTRQMNLQQFVTWWDDLSDPKVATPSSTLADIKADIEKLCSFESVCTVQVKQAVTALSAKVSAVQAKAHKHK